MTHHENDLQLLLADPEHELLGFYELIQILSLVYIQRDSRPDAFDSWLSEQIELLPEHAELVEELERHANRLVERVPHSDSEAQERWLRDIGELDLARRGARLLGEAIPDGERFASAIDTRLDRLGTIVSEQKWLVSHSRLATEALSSLDEDATPWSLLPSGPADAPTEDLIEAWFEGRLSSGAAEDLRSRVAQPGPEQDIYRRLVRERAETVHLTAWQPEHSLDIALTREEAPSARLLARFALLHLGEGAEVAVTHHAEGTFWSIPWRAEGDLVPIGSSTYLWGDEITGEITTSLSVDEPDALSHIRRAVGIVRFIAEDPSAPRALDVARTLAKELSSGRAREQMAVAQILFSQGHDEDGETADWVAAALDLRVHLEMFASRVDDGTLLDSLALTDRALAPHANALLLLEDDQYDHAVDGFPVDEDEWWGSRERLESRVPGVDLDDALSEVESSSDSVNEALPLALPSGGSFHHQSVPQVTISDQLGLARFAADDGAVHDPEELYGKAIELAHARPCPWLIRELRVALDRLSDSDGVESFQVDSLRWALRPKPGRTPLLLVDGAGKGSLVELRITARPCQAGVSALRGFGRSATKALRDAHRAAARFMPSGRPGAMLDDHEISFKGLEGADIEIDGESLGLPAALAFLSLWLDQPLPSDLAATGRLMLRDGEVSALPISGMSAKAAALRDAWGKSDEKPRALVGDKQPDQTSIVDVIAASTLEEAIGIAGLDLSKAEPSSELGDVMSRKKRLADIVGDVEPQNLAQHGSCVDGADPWNVLADELLLLIDSLVDAKGVSKELLDKARVLAALAYTHAGDFEGAEHLLGNIEIDETTEPPVAVLWHIVRMGNLIDAEDWSECERLSTEADVWAAKLTGEKIGELIGRVKGTQGRVLLHQRRLEEAVPLLEEGVELHCTQAPHEAGRSRVYLAMALRMKGDLEAARNQLDLARSELQRETLPFSDPYYRNCILYWRYERARLALEFGEAEQAVSLANKALEDTAWRGFWPELGIRRTLAWSLREVGRIEDADKQVATMRTLIPSGVVEMADGIIREAAGTLRTDGEVY